MNIERGSTHLKDHPANPFRSKNLASLIEQGRIPVFIDFETGDYKGTICFVPPVDLRATDAPIWRNSSLHWETATGELKSPELVLWAGRSKAGRLAHKIKNAQNYLGNHT